MLKIIHCEFAKLKRKHFVFLVILAALLFPIPMTAMFLLLPRLHDKYPTAAMQFDGMWQSVLGFGIQMLLPCILGVLAAILFFMERDNNTFKNLRAIPVTSKQMVVGKIAVLFIFSIIFCLASTIVSILLGGVFFEVTGVFYKLWMSVLMGIMVTAGTLPLVIVIVLFNKTYIFSVLLCIFYSVLNSFTEFMMTELPKAVVFALPVPLINLWSSNDMQNHVIMGDADDLLMFKSLDLIPSTKLTFTILTVMAFTSVGIIIYLYKKWEEC